MNSINYYDSDLEDDKKKSIIKTQQFIHKKDKKSIRSSLRNFSLISYFDTDYQYCKKNFILMIFLSSFGTLIMGYNEAVFDTMESQILDSFRLSSYDGNTIITMISSFITIGASIGSLISGVISNSIGRKNTFLLLNTITIIGSILTIISSPIYVISGRLLVGLGVGGFSYISRLYLAEMSPSKERGLALAIIEVFYIVGIQLAYLMGLGYWITVYWWKIMFGLNILILLIHINVTFFFFNIETPIFHYISTKNIESTREIAKRIYPIEEEVDIYIKEIKQISNMKSKLMNISYMDLFRMEYRNKTIICLLIISCSILTGVDTLIYYLEFILDYFIDSHSEIKIKINILSGLMLIMSVIGIFVSEHFGRKRLLIIGYLLISIVLFTIGILYYYRIYSFHLYLFGIILSLNVLIISSVTNLYLIEILPEKGLALCYSFYYFIKLFLIISFRTISFSSLKYHGQFWIYSSFSFLSYIFSLVAVRETMNKTLLQIYQLY